MQQGVKKKGSKRKSRKKKMNSKTINQFARVAFDVPIESLDYRIDEEKKVTGGDRVVVPLGDWKLQEGLLIRSSVRNW